MNPPKGAAAMPPIRRPTVATVNASMPSAAMKVAETVTVRKNSAVETVPIAFLGLALALALRESTMVCQQGRTSEHARPAADLQRSAFRTMSFDGRSSSCSRGSRRPESLSPP